MQYICICITCSLVNTSSVTLTTSLNAVSIRKTMSSQDSSSVVDELLLERALQSYTKDSNLKVINFKLEIATSQGDDLSSDIHRAIVEFSSNGDRGVRTVIVKVAPSDDSIRRQMVRILSFIK